MISAIQNSPVNTPKPQYKVAFGDKTDKLLKLGEKFIEGGMIKTSTPMKKTLTNFLESLPNTFEKFVNWLIGFKG